MLVQTPQALLIVRMSKSVEAELIGAVTRPYSLVVRLVIRHECCDLVLAILVSASVHLVDRNGGLSGSSLKQLLNLGNACIVIQAVLG